MHRRFEHFLTTLVFTSAALAPAHAAELGDARVSSHIGQQLVADIDLAMVDDPSAQVGVRLASPEVYNGAGVAMPPVLASLNLSVMRRDGRQFLHVTSLRPVDAEHLHLYLELSDKGQRAVRLVTLWLTPDPNPAPAPRPVAAPVPVPVPVVAPVAAPAPAVAPAPRMQPRVAPARTAAVAPPALPQPKMAEPKAPEAKAPEPKAAEPKAPEPKASEPKAAQPKPPLALPVTHVKTALPAPHGDAAPAACAHPSREAQACTALDAKNAALRAQLGKLEEKVRSLQATLGVAATPAKAAGDAPAKPPTIDARTMQQAQKTQDAHDAHAAAAKAAAEHKEEHKAAPAPAKAEPAPAAKDADAEQPPESARPEEAKPEEAKPADAPKPPEPLKPAGPKPISSIKPLVVRKPKTPPPDDSLPWGAIGAGVALLAALGGGAALLMKRRTKSRKVDIPADPGLLEKLKQRFAARNKAPAPAADRVDKAAEPTLE